MQVNLSKIIMYVVLTVLAIYCSRQFVVRYGSLMAVDVSEDPLTMIETPHHNAEVPAKTNEVENATEETSTTAEEQPEETPATESEEPVIKPADTNEVAAVTPPDPRPESQSITKQGIERNTTSTTDASGIAIYAFGMFGTLIGLGFLIAHDVSTFLGAKTHKLLHNEDGEGIHSVDYDKAEDVWANGDYLEAIRLMREYLNKNPREVHVMARIAEIYEKDLGNYLAAALEYEEFLKHKLPAERWGWAAIHLVNLYYGKLDKPTQGLAMLWRIHREYGQTQAAAKARKRLAQIDPDFAVEQARLEREAAEAEAAEAIGDDDEESETAEEGSYYAEEPSAAWQEPEEDPNSHLPKGFRPKKK